MTEPVITDKYEQITGQIDDLDKYVQQSYDKNIDWYWKASSSNKRSYKRYKFYTIALSALVTLFSALSSSEYITSNNFLRSEFAIATPVLAATLMMISSFSQNFQWGASWRDMVITAQKLQREKHRFLTTAPENRDYQQELRIIDEMTIEEAQAFFERTGV